MSARNSTELPSALRKPLARLRSLIRRHVLVETSIWAALTFVVAFWVFGLIDYLPIKVGISESPKFARLAMLALIVVAVLYIAIRYGILRLITRWSNSALALLIERHYPGFHSSLVTTVEMRQRLANGTNPVERKDQPEVEALASTAAPTAASNATSHHAMLELTELDAVRQMESTDVGTMLRWRSIQWQATLLGILAVASLVFIFLEPGWTQLWASRLFALSEEKWPRETEVRVDGVELAVPLFSRQTTPVRYLQPFENGIAQVPKGSEAAFRVSADVESKRAPESCTVLYRKDDGARGRAMMRRLTSTDTQWQPFVLEGAPFDAIDQPLDLTVVADDSRISGYRLDVVDSPIITELELIIEKPDYLMKTSATGVRIEKTKYRLGVRIPQGSSLTLRGSSNTELEAVDYSIVSSGPKPAAQSRAAGSSGGPDLAAVSDAMDGEPTEDSLFQRIVADGTTFEIPIGQMTVNQVIEFRVWDKRSICSQRIQQYVLTVENDLPPSLDLTLAGIGTAVTPTARIPVQTTIEDDNGIERAWLSISDADQTLERSINSVSDKQETVIDLRDLAKAGELDAAVDSQLTVNAYARDFFDLKDPAVGESERTSNASPATLDVVTADELLVMLERRELTTRTRLEQIIGELEQMRSLLDKINEVDSTALEAANLESAAVGQRNPGLVSLAVNQAEPKSEREIRLRIARLQNLRAQQSTTQALKSAGELTGVEREISKIRDELINNRMDKTDRISRLENKIRQPLASIVDERFKELAVNLATLERSVQAGSLVNPDGLADSANSTDEILSALQSVLQDMIDIQDFNEVVEMVRDLIDAQNELMDETKQEQKRRIFDLDGFK